MLLSITGNDAALTPALYDSRAKCPRFGWFVATTMMSRILADNFGSQMTRHTRLRARLPQIIHSWRLVGGCFSSLRVLMDMWFADDSCFNRRGVYRCCHCDRITGCISEWCGVFGTTGLSIRCCRRCDFYNLIGRAFRHASAATR